jgi:hypothetical protein
VFEPVIDPKVFAKYKANPKYYVPIAFRLNDTQQAEINEVATKFKEIYFGGGDPNLLKINDWVQFQSDSMFTFGIDRTTRFHAKKSAPVYYYQFSKLGSMDVLKNAIGLALYPGSMHTDVSRKWWPKQAVVWLMLLIFKLQTLLSLRKKNYSEFTSVQFQELFHLFDPERFPVAYVPDPSAILTRMQVVKMWTNFAKFGFV